MVILLAGALCLLVIAGIVGLIVWLVIRANEGPQQPRHHQYPPGGPYPPHGGGPYPPSGGPHPPQNY
ncbi:hypothetical protein GV791_23775 [Nocardia cyriacigeorgica]|uniref:Uncharacterized protein n=1 Tax=Nocardia cyriacigeorgica TaxID=135487 RepID=A0A6P1CV85_9NOCA|nr:hypothetical protein [Nocardia cyriacigeorgica]MBF6286683.1 hypothetical protein [Nocardia cyriacigeorgica]NEW35563.1 hypothetical protein [Nocardia cyriacigeorgica]BDT84303.1 hypothetical protein FMUAM8_00670 [Nocardia cyriacigeorgica]